MGLYDRVKGVVWTRPKNFVLRKTEETVMGVGGFVMNHGLWVVNRFNSHVVNPHAEHERAIRVRRASYLASEDKMFNDEVGSIGRVELELSPMKLAKREPNMHYWVLVHLYNEVCLMIDSFCLWAWR